MIARLLIVLPAILAAACSYSDKDFNLTDTERSYLNALKAGDTICFESSGKQWDSFVVLGIDSNQKKESGYLMALPAFNNVFVSIKHLPVDNFVSVSQDMTTKTIDTVHEQLICISKYPQERESAVSFQFKHFYYDSKSMPASTHTDTVINNTRLTDYFIINGSADPDTAYTKIEQLYWTRKEGLVAYKQKNGIFWTRKK